MSTEDYTRRGGQKPAVELHGVPHQPIEYFRAMGATRGPWAWWLRQQGWDEADCIECMLGRGCLQDPPCEASR